LFLNKCKTKPDCYESGGFSAIGGRREEKKTRIMSKLLFAQTCMKLAVAMKMSRIIGT